MTRLPFLFALLIAAPAFAQSGDLPATALDGGPRALVVTGIEGKLNLRAEASTGSAVVAQVAAGTVLANLGCEMAGGRGWCDVQPLEGGPRGYAAADFLAGAVGPDGIVATGPDMSSLRAGGGDFDATGQVACRVAGTSGQCDFGVARDRGGWATLVVTRPDGLKRAIYFALGRAIGADTSEAAPGAFAATRSGDTTAVSIGDETYDIPDAAVLGG